VQKYYSHHVHTAMGSVGDSVLRIEEYVKRGKEYGLDTLTITDHGSLSAMYAFADECKKHDIKPIIGMEAYTCDDNTQKENNDRGHLVLLAKDNAGLKNLMSIHNNAWMQGRYYKPRTDAVHLQMWGQGIIALSACVSGDIPKAILAGNIEEAVEIAEFFKSVFSEFYLEIQPGSFEDQLKVNDGIAQIHYGTGIPVVITNDVHYLNAEDYHTHDCHVKLCRSHDDDEKISMDDESLVYPDICYWFMSAVDVKDAIQRSEYVTDELIEEALENAKHIAEVCNVEIPEGLHMPKFHVENGKTEREVLHEMCYESLMEIIQDKDNPQEYVDRLERELSVIDKKGFNGYFLIVQDYVNWARNKGIPVGPGRGSAAGSLVNYVLGISQADPIKHGLMFERFLDENRAVCPDIDVDFSDSAEGGRDTMFDYICDKYGHDKCARVSALGIRKSRSAIKDAARLLGMEPSEANEISKMIPQVSYGDDGEKMTDLDLSTALEVSKDLAAEQKKNPELFALALKLEGLPRTTTIHAAGILVSPDSLVETMPLIQTKKEGENVLATSLTLDDAERTACKFDMLGVRILSVLDKAQKNAGFTFDWRNESLYEDEKVWAAIGSRATEGMFQISSKIYKDRMPRLAPKTIDELAACLALVRGPCISAKADEKYMKILEGKQEIEEIDPIYDEITRETNGILLYQEQILKIAHAYGFDMSDAYGLMKMAQRKKVKALQEFRPQFIEKAMKTGSAEDSAGKVYDMIVAAGLYSFNASHALSYALITYATAYMKVHYPAEFMAAYLTYAYTDAKAQKNRKETGPATIIDDCRRMGISFLPADCNKSGWEFNVEDGKIRVGMCAVKGFGKKHAEIIENCRPLDCIDDIFENYTQADFNIGAVRIGIFSGLFDKLSNKPRTDAYVEYLENHDRDIPEDGDIKVSTGIIVNTETTEQELEQKLFGALFISDPVNNMDKIGFDKLKKNQVFKTAGVLRKIKRITTKNKQKMAFLEMATADSILDVTVFPDKYEEIKGAKKDNVYVFSARKEKEDGCILSALEGLDEC